MTVPAQRVRRRPSGRVLPLLLVVAMLAPVAFLFAQHHRLTGDDRDWRSGNDSASSTCARSAR